MANSKKALSEAYLAFKEAYLAKHAGLTEGSLFGMPCLKASNKAFCGSYDGGLVVKLSPSEAVEALALEGAELFDPSGKGRPMKNWVVVPEAHMKAWGRLADAARSAQTKPTG